MTPPRPAAAELLAPAEEILTSFTGDHHGKRLDVLEAAAAVLGGCSLTTLRATDNDRRHLTTEEALFAGDLVRVALLSTPIHPALALASLAQPPLRRTEKRRSGTYYTDFRLAWFLVRQLPRELRPTDTVLDPASGTGILLVSAALCFAADGNQLDRFIARSACAADLSPGALRGVKLALASLTADDAAIESLSTRLRRVDSLVAGPAVWEDVAPGGFRLVVGNPPWEKLKLSRHEHLAENGVDRHYGADYPEGDLDGLGDARARMRAYAADMRALYEREGRGESDLYRLFLALAMRLATPTDGGQIAMLVPAGLIRSQGTEPLRRDLFERAAELRLTVFENRSRFFSIDSRFKFLALHASLAAGKRRAMLALQHADADAERASAISSVQISRAHLRRLRPDLTVPEVRTAAEWSLFRRMAEAGGRLGSLSEWPLDIARELDMTNDRDLLTREPGVEALPVIEGRMVHQFRSDYKAYVSGSGRSAIWRVTEPSEDRIYPQFWVEARWLDPALRRRVATERVGFCDITGQTNERTMLAARIPAGAVCGNKVPTITFAAHRSPAAAARLWLAVANSLAFDWLLRRLVTTTVNFFVLRSVPFPLLTVASPDGQRLITLAGRIEARSTAAEMAACRAEIDALTMRAYGLRREDVALVLDDFPLLDRGQPPLPGEMRSTVTRDLVEEKFAALEGSGGEAVRRRLEAAASKGATAYVPAQASAAKRASDAVVVG